MPWAITVAPEGSLYFNNHPQQFELLDVQFSLLININLD